MNLFSAFFVVAVVLSSASWVQSSLSSCSADQELAAQEAMKKCNSQIKRCYIEFSERVNLQDLYCKGMKKLFDCADDERDILGCRSEAFDKWMFVVLQYVVIGMRLGVCSGTKYYTQDEKSKLLTLVKNLDNSERFKGKGITNTSPAASLAEIECAKKIHRPCFEILVKGSVADETNLCKGVGDFVECYQEKVDTPPVGCEAGVPEISRKFNNIIQELSGGSQGLIAEYEVDEQHMCFADDKYHCLIEN